jgi:NhaA family Na+:H+ antiporter
MLGGIGFTMSIFITLLAFKMMEEVITYKNCDFDCFFFAGTGFLMVKIWFEIQ